MLGWLHAVPEGSKKARIEDEKWPLPDCEKFNYLAQFFIDLRLSFGIIEVKAWADLTGNEPEEWELNLLLEMSSVYQNSTMKYREKRYDVRPPYDGLEDKSEITRKRLSALFGD